MGSSEKAILRTLIYSQIFGFPLTNDELYYYLHSDHPQTIQEFKASLVRATDYLTGKDGFVALAGKEGLIEKRFSLQSEVKKKRRLAADIARWLSLLPTVYFIGISGSVGVGQGKKDDDIDLFLICRKNTLFVTRFLALALLSLIGKRRKRGAKNVRDLICLNMMIDETALSLPGVGRNIYTAHEIAQIFPLFEREGMYKKFLRANRWMARFLPQAQHGREQGVLQAKPSWLALFFLPWEFPAAVLQKLLINRHTSRETVSNHLIAFHPLDYQHRTVSAYKEALDLYEKYYNVSLRG